MSLADLDQTIVKFINKCAEELEEALGSDLIFYHGPIHPGLFREFRNFVEEVSECSERNDRSVSIVLRTTGGSAETVERMVDVLRNHYDVINFIVPDMAMSAGTIFCMAGDKIYMDYSSALGPIDPQVVTSDGTAYLPALGYLDKVQELTLKGTLSPAEAILLKGIDLGKLALFEQAKNLSIDLLKNWLVEYKFKNWVTHRTHDVGTIVTPEQKEIRATEIARDLTDHKRWRSHGRALNISRLKQIGLDIDDYSNNKDLREKVRLYNDLLTSHIDRLNMTYYFHSHLRDTL
ncbi:MAG: hypothetical protein RJA87_2003 [Pseudomonadota bacterium]|jgi:hypothetical protein